MNLNLLEGLLSESESDALDFKVSQYRFVGATNEEKGELLKDILAFANSWRRTDAFILIGVEEIKGGSVVVHGISEHFDDSDLQQFINSKTQKPLAFSYETFSYEGKQLGIITIPLQQRPFFAVKDFGRIKKDTVYVRRGSSTAEANPDEIAKMGISLSSQTPELPKLELQFADNKRGKILGTVVSIQSILVSYNDHDIKPIQPPKLTAQQLILEVSSSYSSKENLNYPVEKARYISKTSILVPLGIAILNIGSVLISDCRIEISLESSTADYTIVDKRTYPKNPSRYKEILGRDIPTPSYLRVKELEKEWLLQAQFGNIQPGAIAFCADNFFIGAESPCEIQLKARVYADNIPKPLEVPMQIKIDVNRRELDLKELL